MAPSRRRRHPPRPARSLPTPSWRPPLAECEVEELDRRLDADNTLRVRKVWDRDRLVDFTMTHLVVRGGRPHVVIRADCRHGEVHLHRHRRGVRRPGRVVVRPIIEQRDVELGYAEVHHDVHEHWRENLRRWSRGRHGR